MHEEIPKPFKAASLRLPESRANWALLLDLDGTPLDLASTPKDVVVPSGLVDDLRGASRLLVGALALVSAPLGRGCPPRLDDTTPPRWPLN